MSIVIAPHVNSYRMLSPNYNELAIQGKVLHCEYLHILVSYDRQTVQTGLELTRDECSVIYPSVIWQLIYVSHLYRNAFHIFFLCSHLSMQSLQPSNLIPISSLFLAFFLAEPLEPQQTSNRTNPRLYSKFQITVVVNSMSLYLTSFLQVDVGSWKNSALQQQYCLSE